MNFRSINLVNIKGYTYAQNGNVSDIYHPCLEISSLPNSNTYFKILLPLTSDANYAICDKNGPLYVKSDCYAYTKIREVSELFEAKDYYRNQGKYKFAENLDIGSRCYHHIKEHKSYLTQCVPCFFEKPNLRFHRFETKNYNEFKAEAEKKFEIAIIKDKLDCYEAKTQAFNNPNEISYFSLSMKDRFDIAYTLYCDRIQLRNEKPIDKMTYFHTFEKYQSKEIIEQNQLDILKKSLILERLDAKIESIKDYLKDQQTDKLQLIFAKELDVVQYLSKIKIEEKCKEKIEILETKVGKLIIDIEKIRENIAEKCDDIYHLEQTVKEEKNFKKQDIDISGGDDDAE